MDIQRAGSQPSQPAPADWFTGTGIVVASMLTRSARNRCGAEFGLHANVAPIVSRERKGALLLIRW